MDYVIYFEGLKRKLQGLTDTKIITKNIKEYTKEFFEKDINKVVLYSKNGGEFLYDVSVLSFDPKKVIGSKKREIIINNNFLEYNSFLLLESELGGESASSALGVFRNVVKDFLKLMIGNSKYKVMIMAVSPYKEEHNYIENRLKVLEELYKKSECNSDILILTIEGFHRKEKTQIKLDTSKMHYKIFSKNNN
ncbi:hypothetical protein P5F24_11145 [Clostridium perfringens]|nr:hypothetical protein [Clostridium perfringens]MDM0816252.1 hypothetical protein [Clostridium perfringens]